MTETSFGLDPLCLFFHYTFWLTLGAAVPFTHHLKHTHICMKKDQSNTAQQIDTITNYLVLASKPVFSKTATSLM